MHYKFCMMMMIMPVLAPNETVKQITHYQTTGSFDCYNKSIANILHQFRVAGTGAASTGLRNNEKSIISVKHSQTACPLCYAVSNNISQPEIVNGTDTSYVREHCRVQESTALKECRHVAACARKSACHSCVSQ